MNLGSARFLPPWRSSQSWVPISFAMSLLVALWYAVSLFVIDEPIRFILPLPHVVVIDGLFNFGKSKEILEGALTTTLVVIAGLIVSIFLGIFLSVLMIQAQWLERILFPWMVALQAVPIIAITPLVGLWLGYGTLSRVFVTIIISIFPIITNSVFGMQSISSNMSDLFAMHTSSRLSRLVKLQLPAAIPAILTGFQISAGLSVVGAVVGEFFFRGGSTKGLGRLISTYQPTAGQGPQLYAAILLASLIGVALFVLASWLKSKVAINR